LGNVGLKSMRDINVQMSVELINNQNLRVRGRNKLHKKLE